MPYIAKLVKRIAVSLCAFTVIVSSACGVPDAEQATEPETPVLPAERVSTIRLSPDSMQAAVGSRVRLVAEARNANGQLMLRERMNWSSSDSTIALVDTTGEVVLLDTGLVEITATLQGARGRGKIKVTNIVASVSVSPAMATVQIGQTVALTALASNSTGGTLSGRAVTWTSDAPITATVNSTGVVTGVAAGTVQVRATIDGMSGGASITVTAPPPPPPAPAPATQVAIQTQPGGALSGASLSPQPVVVIRDANNQLVNSTAAVTVSIASGGGTLDGTTTVNAVAGTATFANLSISGTAGTRTLRFTSTGLTAAVSASLTITVPTLPPPPAGVVFASSWNTATGNTGTAVTDGGAWNDYYSCSRSDVLSVVSGGTLGWSRSPNVLRVSEIGGYACGAVQRRQIVPAGTSHWGRMYFRNDETTQNNSMHNFSYNFVGSIQMIWFNRVATANGFRLDVRMPAAYPFNIWRLMSSAGTNPLSPPDIQLSNRTWYRYEWHLEYISATRVRFWPRVYNDAGALLYDASNFYQIDSPTSGTATLAAWYAAGNSFVPGDLELMRHIGVGNEGRAADVRPGESWYIGNFAVSTAGWVGP